jgi:hypothetical protein
MGWRPTLVERALKGLVFFLLSFFSSSKTSTLSPEEARQQAQAEKLTLVVAENATGYFGVRLARPGKPKPYQAQVRRNGKEMHLGSFATAEEAALCVARTPEGRAAAAKRL